MFTVACYHQYLRGVIVCFWVDKERQGEREIERFRDIVKALLTIYLDISGGSSFSIYS